MLNKANVFAKFKLKLEAAPLVIVADTGCVCLICNPAGVDHVTPPDPSLVNTSLAVPLVVGNVRPPAVNAPVMVTPLVVVSNFLPPVDVDPQYSSTLKASPFVVPFSRTLIASTPEFFR